MLLLRITLSQPSLDRYRLQLPTFLHLLRHYAGNYRGIILSTAISQNIVLIWSLGLRLPPDGKKNHRSYSSTLGDRR